jgi:hypothetical protein
LKLFVGDRVVFLEPEKYQSIDNKKTNFFEAVKISKTKQPKFLAKTIFAKSVGWLKGKKIKQRLTG